MAKWLRIELCNSQENKNRLIVQFRFIYISNIILYTVINFFDFLKRYVMFINSVVVDIRHIVCLLVISIRSQMVNFAHIQIEQKINQNFFKKID